MADKILADTDVLIDYLRGHSGAIRFLESHAGRIAISAISVAELYAGARPGEHEALSEFLSAMDVLPIDASKAERAGRLKSEYGRSHGVGLADALIAATAIEEKLPLKTGNVKHFPMLSGLKVPYAK